MRRALPGLRTVGLAALFLIGAASVVAPAAAQPAGTQPKSAQPKPDPAKLEAAKQHMAAGSALYNDPSGAKCEEAIPEFQKAYELSGSWKALRALAICELKLERDGDAITHYETVLSIGGDQIGPDDKRQIESDLRGLKSATARMTFKSNQPNTKIVATRKPAQGLPITNRYAVSEGTPIALHPGQYTFVASAEGFPDLTWDAEVANGSEGQKELVFVLAPVEKPGPTTPAPVEMERPLPVMFWVFGGLTIACAVTSGTFMGLSTAAKGEYDDQNGTASAAELEALRDDLVTKSIVADVFLGATAASAGATLIFLLTRPEVPVSAEAAWMIVPAVGSTGGGAVVFGHF